MKRFIFIFAIFSMSLLGGWVAAEEEPDPKIERIRVLQEEQTKVTKEYNKQIIDLHTSFKEEIEALSKPETSNERKNQIIAELDDKEKSLKEAYQEKLRQLQREEKEIRMIKEEELEVVPLKPTPKKVKTELEKKLEDKERRMQLQDMIKKQDEELQLEPKTTKKKKDSIGKKLREDKSKDLRKDPKRLDDLHTILHSGSVLKKK